MKRYRELFVLLRNYEWLWPEDEEIKDDESKEAEFTDLEPEEIEEAVLNEKLMQMEDAMYALEDDRLLLIVTELQRYQYRGVRLKEFLAPVKKKIERSDSISAVESVLKWKNSFDK